MRRDLIRVCDVSSSLNEPQRARHVLSAVKRRLALQRERWSKNFFGDQYHFFFTPWHPWQAHYYKVLIPVKTEGEELKYAGEFANYGLPRCVSLICMYRTYPHLACVNDMRLSGCSGWSKMCCLMTSSTAASSPTHSGCGLQTRASLYNVRCVPFIE